MTDASEWEKLHDGHWDTTERLAIPGGWLVRTVWRKAVEMGQPHLDGSAIVFVPWGIVDAQDLDEKIRQRELREAAERGAPLTVEIDHEETETDAQAEVVEISGEPEDIGVAGHNHEPGRRRSRQ